MSRHTTFHIGGPADYFVTPHDMEALVRLLRLCGEQQIPYMVVGNGSNLLVSDQGIRGVVISVKDLDHIERHGDLLVCGAGALLCDVCKFAAEASLEGLEFAYGIPGSVGGAVYMNAGAYGGEMKDTVVSVRCLDGGETREYAGDALAFGYRKSAFTGTGRIITEITVALRPGDADAIRAKMAELYQRRKTKQPLEFPSAGSVFKRPPGHYAGTLIETCGLKGMAVGGAEVSEKHAGFIVNKGGATCEDVRALIGRVQAEVFRQTGVSLESEIKIIEESV